MLHTPRLLLRRWLPEDRPLFRAMNADPEVMRYFPAPLTAQESDQLADRIEAAFAARGWGLFAVELKSERRFLGFTGLSRPGFEAWFTPCVEIGWRLARDVWGQGIASEAAAAVLPYAFEVVGLPELVSFTTRSNLPSRRVMEKIGMHYEAAFDHPNLPPQHPLRPHVLYRLRAAEWKPS